MILVTGATGFVGREVVRALRDDDRRVRALVRRPDSRSAESLASRGCELVQGDVTDAESLRRAAEGCEAIVHLVGIIAGRPADFERTMIEGTRDLVRAAEEADVRRFVLMSALGTSEETKDLVPYYGAKWEMEQAVKGSGSAYTIFRPSFVFGRDGGLLPMFIRQVRLAPVTPVVGSGERRLQPIWIGDVGAYFAKSLSTPESVGRTFDLGGPDQVTWNELFERIKRTLGKRRRTVHLPIGLVRAGAALAERLPKPPVTRDQLSMLEAGDNVGEIVPAVETFGIEPLPLDEQLLRATG